jgi:hypothetical protein
MSASLVYGMPIRATHSFTTITRAGGLFLGDTVEHWLDALARSQGITPPPKPTALYHPGRRQFEEYRRQVRALADQQFGGCSIQYGGDLDAPTFFVLALLPKLIPECQAMTPLDLGKLQSLVTEQVQDNVRRFCEALGIEYTQPGWYLIESWVTE